MAPNFLHLQNYIPTLAVHTWTLAIEEHFYLLLPFALLWITRPLSARRTALWITVAAAVIFAVLTSIYWIVPRLAVPAELAGYYKPYHHVGFLVLVGAQLFIFVALVLFVRLKRPAVESLPWLAVAVMVLCLLFRTLTAIWLEKFEIDPSLPVYATHLRLGALLFGVLLAYNHWHRPHAFASWQAGSAALWIGGLTVISTVVFWPQEHWLSSLLVNRSMLYVACGSVMVAALPTAYGTGAGWITRGLARIGVYSYSIYLWHLNPIRFAINDAVAARLHLGDTARWMILTALYVALTLTCGILLSKLIEWPLLRLRDRWFPSELPTAKPIGQAVGSSREVAG